jgi:uncharacterized membrane protein YgcG
MNAIEVVLVAAIVSVIVFFLLQRFLSRPFVQEPEVVPVTQVIEQPVAPYWTVYGLPDYWPYYTSPYWGWNAPYDGVGYSGGYRGQRQKYMPHGWDGRRGYSGVSVGGGGGGGHGGGGHRGR